MVQLWRRRFSPRQFDVSGITHFYDTAHHKVTDRLSADINIVTEWPVKAVSYDSSKDLFSLTNVHGETIHASRVVVTVPLPIIKDSIKLVFLMSLIKKTTFNLILRFRSKKSKRRKVSVMTMLSKLS